MSRKDITDKQVCIACKKYYDKEIDITPDEYLLLETGQLYKVVMAAMERATDRGFIEYGVSLRLAWVTDAGLKII